MNGRAVLTRWSTTACGPEHRTALAAEAFDSVAVTRTCGSPARPSSWTSPGPRTPSPCASSTTSSASYRSHTAARSASGCLVAEHRVDRLDQHQRATVAGPASAASTARHVVVRDDLDGGPREAHGVDQRRVHVRVGDDERVATAQRGARREVGVVAGREHQRRRLPEVRRQLALELRVQLERPGDEPRGARAGAPAPRRRRGRLDDGGVAGEAEVVVAGQVGGGALGRLAAAASAAAPRVACGRPAAPASPATGHATATARSIAAQIRATSSSEVT